MRTLLLPARDESPPNVLAALSDPLSLRVLRELAVAGEAPCSALYQSMAKSTLARHMQALREGGVTRIRSADASLFNLYDMKQRIARCRFISRRSD